MANKKDRVIYSLSVADIQEVAADILDRELTPEEVKLIEDRVGDYIPWYDALARALNEIFPTQNVGDDLKLFRD